MKIGIIGKGNVGTALASGWKPKGHEIKFGHRDPKEPVKKAAQWGEIVVFAVPYGAIPNVVDAVGSAIDGKILLDVTNVLTKEWEMALGFSTSGAEELQKKLPKARVVKAFNTVFAPNQSKAEIGGEQLTLFVASDDSEAKQTIMKLGRDIGFDSVDGGPLKSARYLESMGMFLITLGYKLDMGTDIGFKLVKS